MRRIDNKKDFLQGVISLDESLSALKLHRIEIDSQNQSIMYDFISDIVVPDAIKRKVFNFVRDNTDPVFTNVAVTYSKVASDPELIAKELFEFIKKSYTSVTMFFEKEDISVDISGDYVRYTLMLSHDAKEYFDINGITREINAYLETCFCSTFLGETVIKQGAREIEINLDHEDYFEAPVTLLRKMQVTDIRVIDDKQIGDTAVYMSDVTDPGSVVLCGTVTDIREKVSKNEKPFFIIDFTDKTAKLSGIYFSKKSTIEKIRKIEVGSDIIVSGKFEYYRDKGLRLTIGKINLCKLSENFVPEEKPLAPAPTSYTSVYPVPVSDAKVFSIFDKEAPLPEKVLNTTYVSVDLETTGVNVDYDVITEIGAAKIVNGKITETWTALVNPERKLDEQNIKVTGITDEMVENCPLIDAVYGDFLHFTDGAVIVGHNMIEFDCKFLQKVAKNMGYAFNHDYEDTLNLSREFLPGLKNYKLNTVADHFEIEFHHHRALADAYATAEVFLELMKIKKKNEK